MARLGGRSAEEVAALLNRVGGAGAGGADAPEAARAQEAEAAAKQGGA